MSHISKKENLVTRTSSLIIGIIAGVCFAIELYEFLKKMKSITCHTYLKVGVSHRLSVNQCFRIFETLVPIKIIRPKAFGFQEYQ